ncbi:hypothetical protein ABW19_dt0204837 [Dactylella cylindrospora]|nr:hypothetical protein ABW19_dt0204837 [Dactylella cylindrospora]
MASSIHPPTLIATYTHPSSHPPATPYAISKSLPPPPTATSTSTSHTPPSPLHTTPSATSKTHHLNHLRSLVSELQSDLNTFLTARMEEEKAAGGTANAGALKAAEEMEKDGEMEEEMDEETKRLEEEVERSKREEREEKERRKKEKGGKKKGR